MTKKLLLASLFLSFIYCIPTIAQNYDHKIKVTITIKDEVVPTRPASIIQHHTLSFEEHPNFVFGMSDHVGFEFYINNQSQSGKTFHYRVGFTPRNGEVISSDGDEIPTGVLTPIVLPPVDDDEDESGQTGPVGDPYPYTLEGEYLDWGTTLGIQPFRVFLSIKNEHNDYYTYKDEISNTFQTIISNVTPVDGDKSNSDKIDLKLYPNPLDTHLFIESKKHNNSMAIVEVYTMQGVLLKKSSIQPIHKNHISYYDFTNPHTLKRGTYVYKIIIDKETYIKLLQKK